MTDRIRSRSGPEFVGEGDTPAHFGSCTNAPDWLRVSFGLGDGVYFKTDASKTFDNYWLATEVEGEEGHVPFKDRADKVFVHDGIKYDVIRGNTARLRLDSKSWTELVSKRTHVPGR